MTISRFLLIVLYIGYLVNVGLFFLLLPWSRVWGLFLTQIPLGLSPLLDSPWLRGLLSAFGALHLLLVLWELVSPTLVNPSAQQKVTSE